MNFIPPKAAAKRELLFNKPTTGLLRKAAVLSVTKVIKLNGFGHTMLCSLEGSLHWGHLLAKPLVTATCDSHYSTCLGHLR